MNTWMSSRRMAAILAGNATVRVRLEGHTDERGSREYNIGLGERRAQTVKRALMLQGVQESQIATVSYGEERPGRGGQRRGCVVEESSRRDRLHQLGQGTGCRS